LAASGLNVFLDFEASSLRAESYPIEVGVVDETGEGFGVMIRCEPGWTDWSSESEGVHGISIEQLIEYGQPAATIARRVHAIISRPGVSVVVSSTEFDGMWLEQLLATADLPCPRVHDVYTAYARATAPLMGLLPSILSPSYLGRRAQIRAAAEILIMNAEDAEERRQPTQHRALEDAQSIWRVWNEVKIAVSLYVERERAGE